MEGPRKCTARAARLADAWHIGHGEVVGRGPNGFITVDDLVAHRVTKHRCHPRPLVWEVDDERALVFAPMPPGCHYLLRDDQDRAVTAVVDSDEHGAPLRVRSGILHIACGGGKTVIGCVLIQRLAARTVIVSVHSISLLQWQKHLSQMGVECVIAGCDTPSRLSIEPGAPWPSVVCITYSALTVALEHQRGRMTDAHAIFCRDDIGLVILDEVHCAPADVFSAACTLPARAVVGLSGSLVREDNRIGTLAESVGPVLCSIQARELVDCGVLADCEHVVHILPCSDAAAIEFQSSRGNRRIVASLDGPKIVFCVDLLHTKMADKCIIVFFDSLPGIGLFTEHLRSCVGDDFTVLDPITGSSSLAMRMETFARFDRASRATILVISRVGNEAIDFKSAEAVIQVCQGSGSRKDEMQRSGRVSRMSAHYRKSAVSMHTLATAGSGEVGFALRRTQHLRELKAKVSVVRVTETPMMHAARTSDEQLWRRVIDATGQIKRADVGASSVGHPVDMFRASKKKKTSLCKPSRP